MKKAGSFQSLPFPGGNYPSYFLFLASTGLNEARSYPLSGPPSKFFNSLHHKKSITPAQIIGRSERISLMDREAGNFCYLTPPFNQTAKEVLLWKVYIKVRNVRGCERISDYEWLTSYHDVEINSGFFSWLHVF